MSFRRESPTFLSQGESRIIGTISAGNIDLPERFLYFGGISLIRKCALAEMLQDFIGTPCHYGNFGLIRSRRVQNRIYIPFLPESEIPVLYQASSAFIFPTSEEGFGLPVLEAFASGIPVICNRIPVFQEYFPNGPVFFEIEQRDTLKKAMEYAFKPDIISAFKTKGPEIAKSFTWEACAEKTRKTLEECL